MKNEYYSSKKRFLAVILSLMMIFQMLPAGVLAEGNEEKITSEPTRASTYTITFQNAEGVTVGEITRAVGQPISESAPATPEAPAGKAFIGWFCGETEFSTGLTPNGSMVFTPKYGWIVYFRNRDGIVTETRTVEEGAPIGTLPPVIEREDYHAFWAIGTYQQGGQGGEWKPGTRINSEYVVTSELDIVPDYDEITYTVTFYNSAEKEKTVAEKTVNVNTNYCLNDIPEAPAKAGNTAKWVYDGGDFTNSVAVTTNIDVWPVYTQNVFTVNFLIDEEVFSTDTYYAGDALTLPTEPVVEGKQFSGWYIDDTQYTGGEPVNANLDIEAKFVDEYSVSFVVEKEGEEVERLFQYFRTTGEAIGTLPQDPFVQGKKFEKWIDKDTGEEVTADTVVNKNIIAVAQFYTFDVYDITAEYYYLNDHGQEVIFNTDLLQVEAKDLPYTIIAPSSTKTDEEEVEHGPYYYPETPTVTVNKNDFTDHKKTVRFQYVKYTAVYDFVYMLKDLTGEGYTEIDRTSNVEGVLDSYVTPTVKTFDYAVFESAGSAYITQAEGQELQVKYTRKSFQLTYETNGGSYVGGATVLYDTEVAISSTTPTRTGYTFAGWYLDKELTQSAGSAVTVKGDTTLYAAWTGDTVNYTIMYIREQYKEGGNEWVIENDYTASGTVGETVYAATARKLPTTPDAYELDNEKNGTATAGGTGDSTEVIIEADGSTVLKVYYKLIRYTFKFNINRDTGRITIGEQTYSGNQYSFEVVLGENISAKWPAGSDVYDTASGYYKGYFVSWKDGHHSWAQVTRLGAVDKEYFEGANNNHEVTWTAQWASDPGNKAANYWFQQPDGTYQKDPTYAQTDLIVSSLGAKEIAGYSLHNEDASRPDNTYPESGNESHTEQQWVEPYDDVWTWNGKKNDYKIGDTRTRNGHTYTVTDKQERDWWEWGYNQNPYKYTAECHEPGHYEDVTVNVYTYNFYYDRDKFPIEYKYGSTTLNTKNNIFFEADISGPEYNYTPDRPAGVDSDYTWGGWCIDEKCTQPYTFSTMPANKVIVFAKWVAPSYTVSFLDDDGSTAVADSQTVEKYNKVEKPTNPTKEGYVFDGWYTTATGDVQFDWNTQITADTQVYAHWTRNTLSYIVHYVDEQNNTVAPDKTLTSPNYEVGQEVTEQAIAVAGYRPNTLSKTLKLSGKNEENQITFTYSAKVNETSYTVRYILASEESGNQEISVAPDKTETGIPGDKASVIEMAAAINYTAFYEAYPEFNGVEFYPDEPQKTLTLTTNPETNVLVFYYSSFKNAKVTVNYVDMDGNRIPNTQSEIQVLKVGKTFTLSRSPFDGWELDKAVVGTAYSGTEAADSYKITEEVASGNDLTFTLFYKRKVTITAVSASKQYDGDPLTIAANLNDQVIVEGLLTGDTLASIGYKYVNADSTDGKGRVNAGVATVTPKDAVITGNHNSNYYKIRYISGTLEVTKINVTVRIMPDRWVGEIYDGNVRKAGFTNDSKGVADYIIISNEAYADAYLDDIWEFVTTKATYDASAPGLHYYGIAKSDAGDYYYDIEVMLDDLPQNDNYSVGLYVRQGRLEIKPSPVTITTGSDQKVYDGNALTNDEVSIDGLAAADEDKVTVTTTGSQTEVGDSDNTYSIDWGTVKISNYTVTDNLGTLTVTQANLTVTVNNIEKEYNGAEQSGRPFVATVTGTGETIVTDDYTIEGLANGDVLTITYTPAKGTNVTGSPYTGSFAESYTIVNADGENVSRFYETKEFNAGTLVIAKREVTVTVADADDVEYDGNEHTGIEDYTFSNVVSGETATITYTPAKGTLVNTYTGSYGDDFAVKKGDTVLTDNYTLKTKTPGNLTITDRTNKYEIEVVANSSTENVYDGNAHSAEGFVTLEFEVEGNTYTVEGLETSNPSSTNATTGIANAISGTAVVKDAAGNDVTDQFDVTKTNGTLVIAKREVTVTVADADDVEYDGNEHTGIEDYTFSNVVSGETATITYTPAKGTLVNTYTGSYGDDFAVKKGDTVLTDNYTLKTKTPGNLTITDRTNKYEIEVVANSSTENVYDGNAHSAEGFVTLEFEVEGNTYTVEGLETSNPSSTNATTGIANAISGTAVVKDAAGNDVTDQFDVTKTNGTLVIAKREVTVTVADADDVEYDGNEHTGIEDYTFSNVVSGETATITYTPAKGTLVNTYTGSYGDDFAVKKGDTVLTDNYTLKTKTPGNLTITDRTNKYEIEVVANSSTENVYDGNAHSAEGFVTLEFEVEGNTYTVEGLETSNPSSTNATTGIANAISGTAVVKDAAGNDVTDQFDVTKTNGTLVIAKREVTVTVADADDVEYDGNEHTGIEDYTFSNVVSGETATITYTPAKGTLVNTYTGSYGDDFAVKKGDTVLTDNYTLKTKTPGNLTITDRTNKYEIEVVANSSTENVYDGNAHSAEGFVTLEFEVEGNTYTVEGLETSNPSSTNATTGIANAISGTAVVKDAAGNDVTDQFDVTKTNGTLVIAKREVTVTVADADDVEYDGNEHTGIEDYTFSNVVSGETATITYTPAKGTLVNTYTGSYGNDFAVKKGDTVLTDNYTLKTKTPGNLTITDRTNKYEIEVVANSSTENVYDGNAHSAEGFVTLEFEVEGNTYTVEGLETSNPSSTNATTGIANAISGTAVVKDAAGNDVTDQFDVTKTNGTLVIAKREVTVTVADADDVEYDGNEHTGIEDYTFSNVVSGETATITYTPAKGTLVNTYTGSYGDDFAVKKGDTVLTDNYTLKTKTPGNLTITDRTNKYEIEVVANSSTENVYDGNAHSAEGFVTLEFEVEGNTYTVEGLETSNPSSTNATTGIANAISGTAVVKDAAGNDVTDQFDVTKTNGTLVIAKREVTVTVADADDVEYDGNEHTGIEDYTFSNVVSGETATITYTPAKGTLVNTYTGSYGDDFAVKKGDTVLTDNYTLKTKTPGNLTITDRTNKYEIEVVANSSTENVYDGNAHSAEGFVTLEFEVEGNTYTVEGLETSNPSSTNATTGIANAISGTAVVKDAAGNDVTDQFDVTKTNGTLVIAKREVTVTVADADDVEYDGNEHTGIEDYTFSNVVSGETATITYTPAKGTLPDTYTGSYGDDFAVKKGDTVLTDNYTLKTKTPGNLTITDRTNKYEIEVVANSSTENVYDGNAHSAEGFVTLEFEVEGNTYTVEGLETSNPSSTNATTGIANAISGTAVVKDAAGNDVTDQFDVTKTNGTLVIAKREVTVTVADADDVEYDGNEHTGIEDYTFSNVVSGETATITYTPAKGTLVNTYTGSYGNDFAVKKGDTVLTDNYTLKTKTPGNLTITDRTNKYEIEVVANSSTENVYDGNAHSAEGFVTLEFEVEGNTYTVEGLETSNPSSTNATTGIANAISGTAVVKDAAGNDVTDQFDVTKTNGTLVIAKREVTVTVADADDVEYDGNEHTGIEDYTFSNVVSGETATITYTPAKGTLVNTYTGSYGDDFAVKKGDTVLTDNYTLKTKTPGNLTITDRTNKYEIEVVANSSTENVYDGNAHSAEGFVTLEFEVEGNTYTVEGLETSNPSSTNATTGIANAISGTAVVKDAAGNDVTDQFDVTKTNGTLVIAKREVTVTVADADDVEYDGNEHTGIEDYTFSNVVSGETATITYTPAKGTLVNTYTGSYGDDFAVKKGDTVLTDNYTLKTKTPGNLTITDRTNKYEIEVVANSSTENVYDGNAHSAEGFVTLEFEVEGNTYTVEGLETSNPSSTNATTGIANAISGTAVVKDAAGNDVTDQFDVTKTNGTLVIAKREVTVTVADADDVEYDGNEHTGIEDYTFSNVVSGETATITYTPAKGTLVNTYTGSYGNDFAVKKGDTVLTDNYTLKTKTPGNLTITDRTNKYEIEVVANSSTENVYDGNAHSAEGFVTLEFEVEGNTYTVEGLETSNPSSTNATTGIANAISGTAVVKDAAGNDVTDQFDVTKTNGTLVIAKREVTVTVADADDVEYDGNEHTGIEDYTFSNVVSGETATITYTPAKGTLVNTYTGSYGDDFAVKKGDTVLTDNYTLKTKTPGNLTITDRTNKYEIEVVANSSTENVYDGNAHSAEGFVTLEFEVEGNTYTVEGLETSNPSSTNATTGIANAISGTAVVKDAAGNDVTDQFDVTKTNGTLVIAKREVTVTVADADDVEYDGNEHTGIEDYTFSNVVSGETATITYTPAKGTLVNTYTGSYGDDFAVKKGDTVLTDNYTLKTKTPGNLTITDRTNKYEIEVVANSSTENVYDGNAHSAEGFVTLEFEVEGNTYTVEGLETSNPSSTNATTGIANAISGTAVVKDAAGNDVTDQFDVTKTNGTLVIAKREVTVTVADADDVEYDGNEHTGIEDYTFSNVVSGETATITYTPAKGTLVNTYTGSYGDDFAVKKGDTVLTDNYTLKTKTPGNLTITDRTNKYEIEVVANSSTENVYDGNAHSAEGFVTLEFEVEGNTYTVEGLETSNPSSTNATTGIANAISGTAVVKDAAGNDVTDQFDVTKTNGTLVIAKREVTVTVADADDVEYDGNEHTGIEDYTFSNVVSGETATITYTPAKGTLVNTYTGSYGDDFAVKKGDTVLTDNYTLKTKTPGNLTITDRTNKYEIEVVANSSTENVYDGNAHSAEGFVTLEFEVEGNTYTVEGLETSNPSSTNATTGIANAISGTAVVKDAAGNDVTDQFDVTKTNGTLVIAKREVTVTVADADDVEYDGNEHTGIEDYTFSNVVSGETATITYTPAKGTLVNTYTGSYGDDFAVKKGDTVLTDNYTLKTKTPGNLTITDRTNKYEIEVVANSSTENVYDGNAHSAEGFVTLEFEVEGNTYTVEGLETSNPSSTNATTGIANAISGTAVVKDAAGNDVTDQFDVTKTNGTLVIAKREVTVTVADADDVEYDGNEHTGIEDYTFSNVVSGETATITYTPAKGTLPDTYTGSYGDDFAVKKGDTVLTDNYTLKTKTPGNLTITDRTNKYEIEVVANSSTENVYDGNAHSAEGFVTLEFEVEGNTYTVEGLETSNPSSTNATTGIANAISGTAVVKDAAGNDVTKQFTVKTTNGMLEITPRTVTLKSADGTKVYDSTPLTKNAQTDVTVTGDGFADGEGAVYDITGTQTLVGSSENTFTYTLNEGTLAANYTITPVFGLLTVTDGTNPGEDPVPDKLVVTKDDGSEDAYMLGDTVEWTITVKNIYDAEKSLTVTEAEGMTIVGEVPATLTPGQEVTITVQHVVTAEDVRAGSIKNEVTVKIGDLEKKGDDTVETEPIAITITAASDSKVYDGTALTNNGYEVTAGKLSEGNKIAEITVTGSQTLVGESANVASKAKIADAAGSDVTDCYDITYVDGKLTVTDGTNPGEDPVPDRLVVTKDDGSDKTYQMGDMVEWTITVKNIYNETKTLTVTEAEGMRIVGAVPKTLNAGDEATITVQHVVTAADVAAGSIRNEVTVKIGDLEKKGEDTVETEPIAITITASSDTKVYDGTALTNAGYDLTAGSLNRGDRIDTVTVTGTQTEVGRSINVPSNAKIVDAAGNDVTASYKITYVNGALIVTERPMFMLLIRYWQDGRLISTVARTEVSGTAYDVVTPPVSGYTSSAERISGVLTANAEYDVVYTPVEYLLTVRYLYLNGGAAAATYTETLLYGEEYRVQSPVVAGFHTADQLVSGTMPDRNVTITVIYIANGQAINTITIEDFETPLGVGLGGVNTGETIE